MTFHVYLVARGFEAVITDGVTKRPASWPTAEAALAVVDGWKETRAHNSSRDGFVYGYEVRQHTQGDQNGQDVPAVRGEGARQG